MRIRSGWNDERNKLIIWLSGKANQFHIHFQRGSVTFFKITGFACNNYIRPGGFSSTGLGVHMIHCKGMVGNPTILASVIISS